MKSPTDADPTSEQRKKDHIDLAFRSANAASEIDPRFYYEPILAAHPENGAIPETKLLNKTFKAPIWVSSMTGGTALAGKINKNLAKACGEFGLGMGLGSCRSLLESDTYLDDFAVRKYMGDQPLYANLGIAQVEQLIENNSMHLAIELVRKLDADGLIIHVNPLQELLQPEGDKLTKAPIDTIKRALDTFSFPIIVKEVGQGMGYESLLALLALPLQAIEFAANGGTNFSKLELMRGDDLRHQVLSPLVKVGHDIEEMTKCIQFINLADKKWSQCNEFILSGGIKTFLDGYYHIQKLHMPAVYGQASQMLKHATGSYKDLQNFVALQIEGLSISYAYLKLKKLDVQ